MQPLISVIVPIYNVEAYLPKCLDSIIGQTFTDLEILLIDDGATDGSGDICDQYAERDERVCVIHKQNGGASDARNIGLALAMGRYISFVDSDDYIDYDMLERQLDLAIKYNADIVCCGFVHEDEQNHRLKSGSGEFLVCSGPETAKELLQGKLLYTSFCNKLYRRTLIPYMKNDTDIHFTEDLLANYLAVRAANIFVLEDVGRYHYVQRNNSYVQRRLNEGQFDALEVSRRLLELEKDNLELLPYCRRQSIIIQMSLLTRIIKYHRFGERYDGLRNGILEHRNEILQSGLYHSKEKITTLLLWLCPPLYSALVRLKFKIRGN